MYRINDYMSQLQKPDKAGPIDTPIQIKKGGQDIVVPFHFAAYRFSQTSIFYCVWQGNIQGAKNPLVRIHSACSLAQIFHSQICDCEGQLQLALQKVNEEGLGLVIYVLHHEGRGIGYFDHMRAYEVHETKHLDTYESYEVLGFPKELRDYSEAIFLLKKEFHLPRIRLLTNNPDKVESVARAGIEVERTPCLVPITQWNRRQLEAKAKKGGHFIPFENGD